MTDKDINNNYSLDYLLNYCEDCNIATTDIRVTVEDTDLLVDLKNYKEVVFDNVVQGGY
tara:strand:- start:403 stop:579 length:177 start_codon:yes stop_codon:yes gene_type:complete